MSTQCQNLSQGSHYILVLKFKDFSSTFKDPEVAFSRSNSRRKFTAWTVLQQFNIYFCDYGTVIVDKNKTWQLLANLVLGEISGRVKDCADKKHDDNMKYANI